jgi:tRNA(Ile)-lysidine synthase
VDLAVAGGPDSLGLLLLALEGGLEVTVHHVDHHLRAASAADASFVRDVAQRLEVPYRLHDVQVAPGGNVEALARAQRR